MSSDSIDNEDSSPDKISVRLPCGTHLNVFRWNCGDQSLSCLLLHGLDNSARVWDGLARRLMNQYTVYVLDFRGHGLSEWSSIEKYTHAQFVKDVEYVYSYFNLSDIHIVGHSLGGIVASYFSSSCLGQVKSLVLCDIGPDVDDVVLNKMRKDSDTSPNYFLTIRDYKEHMERIYWLADKLVLKRYINFSVNFKDNYYYNRTDPLCRNSFLKKRSNIEINEFWNIISNLTIPVLILRGEYSAVLSDKSVSRMMQLLPLGNFASIKKSGHSIVFDNEDQTIYFVERFLLEQ